MRFLNCFIDLLFSFLLSLHYGLTTEDVEAESAPIASADGPVCIVSATADIKCFPPSPPAVV